MPGLSGLETWRGLQQRRPELPVLFIVQDKSGSMTWAPDGTALAFLRSDPAARPFLRLTPGRFLQANATADLYDDAAADRVAGLLRDAVVGGVAGLRAALRRRS